MHINDNLRLKNVIYFCASITNVYVNERKHIGRVKALILHRVLLQHITELIGSYAKLSTVQKPSIQTEYTAVCS